MIPSAQPAPQSSKKSPNNKSLVKSQSQPPADTKPREIGLESPISFADLLQKSHDVTLEPPSVPDFTSDNTETIELDEDEDVNTNINNKNDELSLSVTTTTKNLLQVADIDGDLLNSTIDSFCINLKNSVEEQFISSRERLFRQSENEINSITKIYQNTLNNKERELNELKNEYTSLNEEYSNLKMQHCKINTSYLETKKKLNCVRHLSQTLMRWKNDCEKKKFVENYINKIIIPNKNKIKMQNIYYLWKNQALSKYHQRYDEIWKKRLETVSKKIIQKYESSINDLRNELNVKTNELEQLHNERKQQQQNMKRAFMRGVSALNLEAMSLFNPQQQKNNNNDDDNE